MKSILLIGLGKFGQTLGKKLLDMGDEVVIVDKNEEIINVLQPFYTNALSTNCMNEDNLRRLDIPSYNVCIVAIGEDFQSSLEITSILKELGAKYIISKASTQIQKKFLLRNGADEVIYPDADIAEKIAVKINSTNVYDFIEINGEYSVFEIEILDKWINKSIAQINFRKKYDMNILTIKKDATRLEPPTPDYLFEKGDHIVVFGKTSTILSFTNKK